MKYFCQIFTKCRTDMVVTLHNSQEGNDDNVCPYFSTPFRGGKQQRIQDGNAGQALRGLVGLDGPAAPVFLGLGLPNMLRLSATKKNHDF